jgi:hypothetical protein
MCVPFQFSDVHFICIKTLGHDLFSENAHRLNCTRISSHPDTGFVRTCVNISGNGGIQSRAYHRYSIVCVIRRDSALRRKGFACSFSKCADVWYLPGFCAMI